MSKHIDKLRTAWLKELTAANGDSERCADLVDNLCRMLGTTVAVTSIGDKGFVDKVCMGIEGYIHEIALLQIAEIKRQID